MTELRLTTAGRRRGMKKRRRDADKLARRTDGLAGESSAKRGPLGAHTADPGAPCTLGLSTEKSQREQPNGKVLTG